MADASVMSARTRVWGSLVRAFSNASSDAAYGHLVHVDDGVVPRADQVADDGRADEAATAGQENSHASIPSTAVRPAANLPAGRQGGNQPGHL